MSELYIIDERNNHIIPTEQALLYAGINIRSRITETYDMEASSVINTIVETASDQIYGYLHETTRNTIDQDNVIAELDSARAIVFKAIMYQVKHLLKYGDLSSDPKEENRRAYLSANATRILGDYIPEIRGTLLDVWR